MKLCPCCSETEYNQCCGKYHSDFNAPTALALMRSRYSAFCLGNFEYIDKTMRDKARIGFKLDESKAWASSVYWLSLQIIDAHDHPTEKDTSYVEFIARFMIKDTIQCIHEKSEFKHIEGQWYYVDGTKPGNKNTPKTIKISRNAPCPCSSKKKFKNCHGIG